LQHLFQKYITFFTKREFCHTPQMNLLITGAFGFVGTSLSKGIKASLKTRLTAVDIAEPDHHIFDEFCSWIGLGNVECDKVDTIIHLAGKAQYFNII
jgi:nucleoside-diphosphate-sugar epimerase